MNFNTKQRNDNTIANENDTPTQQTYSELVQVVGRLEHHLDLGRRRGDGRGEGAMVGACAAAVEGGHTCGR